METTYRNKLLRVTAILFIVFSLLGPAAAVALSLNLVYADLGPGLIFFALVAAIPRFIAGVMGLRRSAAPEKSGFFLAWGITLLVVGSLGMLFLGWFSGFNTLVSLSGGIVLPILYIVGAGRMKRYRAEELTASRMPGINYGALPSGSSPYAPPPSASSHEPVMREAPPRAEYRPQGFADAVSAMPRPEPEPVVNPMLKWTSVLLIVLAVLGAVSALLVAANLREVYFGEHSLFGHMFRSAWHNASVQADPAEAEALQWMLGEDMRWAFGFLGGMMAVSAVLGAVPKLVAGIMGLRRCANPGKHKFFLVWGIVLVVLGVLGLGGAMGMVMHPLLIPGGLVCIGNVAAPIFYIVGAGRMKVQWVNGLSAMPAPALNYGALPAGSSPFAPPPASPPPAPVEPGKPENHGPEF